ncbi:MAG: GGDEF domain-containing protein [Gammaproteobacteria bacterium]|nr:GGDEF domain-containing protein [Gammaproteobacteria bacterium]
MTTRSAKIEITELHWMMDMLQSIDVGLIVLDGDYHVQVWNSFMANHSGVPAKDIIGKKLFEIFADISEEWFKRKAESVVLLNCRSFTTWEQRPYLIKFKNYRPITGPAEFMYQNVTFIPLTSVDGTVNHIGIIIYDVTDSAINGGELEKANSTLQELSRTDHLTKLHNRGYWEARLQEEFLRSKRTGQPCSLILFDIDYFKNVNDAYGHQAGDEVIRLTADQVRKKVRATDIPGRYGGEEFGIILIDTSADSARYLAERLRKAIETMSIEYEGCEICCTISLGVAELSDRIEDYRDWLACADQALYRAKKSGRNRVVAHEDAD